MPNWCSNELTLRGNTEDIQNFHNKNLDENNELDFNFEVPIPSDMQSDWYNWQVANWGTKWTAFDTIHKFHWKDNKEEHIDYLLYCFNTAWSPPTEWLSTVSTKYPNIDFCLKYGECGINFSGIYIIKNGLSLMKEGKYGEYYGEILDESDDN